MKSKLHSFIAMLMIASMVLGPSAPARSYAQDAKPADTVSDDEDVSASSTSGTLISSGFLLHIACPEDAKINGDFRVSMDGSLALPYDQTVNAAGLRVKALEDRLQKTYQPYFKSKPRITVTVKQRKYWIRVLGVVKSPGPYLVRERASLDEVLALAQVKTEDVPNGFVKISSGNRSRWIAMEDYLKGGKDLPAWQGKEVVTFQLDRPEGDFAAKGGGDEDSSPSSRKIQVLGEVRSPGAVSYQKNADGYYYFIQRGGPTQNSDMEEVSVIRRDKKSNEHIEVTRGDIGDIRDIQEADVLLVRPVRQTKTERLLQNAGILAAIISAIAVTAIAVQR